MHLTNWLHGLSTRFSAAKRHRRIKRRKQLRYTPPVEQLEERILLTAPVANDDGTYEVSENTTYDTMMEYAPGVLDNDTDDDYDPLTASLVADVTNGSLTLYSDGSFEYTPDTDYTGTDSFTYKAHDGTSYSNVATVDLNVSEFNNVPEAYDDGTYYATDDKLDTDADSLNGVLYNDTDGDSDPLTAVLVDDVTNGTLTLNSDGSFVYDPDPDFIGTDTFTYKADDGTDQSSAATVTIDVSKPFGDATSPSEPGPKGYSNEGAYATSGIEGGVQVPVGVAAGATLVYTSTAADASPIVAVETTFEGSTAPDGIRVELTLGSLSKITKYYDTTGLVTDDTLRFAIQVDATTLATGRYSYTMDIIADATTGDDATRRYTGTINHVNFSDSTTGDGWNIAVTERLFTGTGGLLHVTGDGSAVWFVDNLDDTYSAAFGSETYGSLVKNIDDTYTFTDRFGFKSEFNDDGILTEHVDLNDNEWAYTYTDADSDGDSDDLTEIEDPYERTTTFAYTSSLLSSITDNDSRVTTITHTSGNLTKIEFEDPDDTGPLAAPDVEFAYVASTSRMSSLTDALNNDTDFDYDFAGRLTDATLPDASVRDYQNLESQGALNPAGGNGSSGNPADLVETLSTAYIWTDELDRDTTTGLSSDQTNWTITDDLGSEYVYAFSETHDLTNPTLPDPDGAGPLGTPEYTYAYDTSGNVTTLTLPDANTQTRTYNSLNLPLTSVNELGKTTTYTYDVDGNLLTVTDALSNVTTYAYNTGGNVTSITRPDPDGAGPLSAAVTSFTYDTVGRVTQISNPDSTTIDYTYDSADNLLTVSDELSQVTTYTYNDLDRLLTVTYADPDGAGPLASPVVSFTYDAAGNLLTETNPAGGVTTYAYDGRGRMTSVTLPDPDGAGAQTSPVVSYTYDAVGNLLTETDPLGNVTTNTYDGLNRLLTVTLADPDGAGALISPVTTYAYNTLGAVTSITENDPDGAGTLGQPVTSFAYDIMGRVTKSTNADSTTVDYTYNAAGSLLTVTDELSRATTNTYDDLGRLSTVTYPDPDGAGPLASPVVSYAYDAAGRVLSKTDQADGVTTYAYDSRDRVTSITFPDPDGGGAQTSPVASYTYDAVGNLLTRTDPLGNVTTYAYDALNRLLTVTLADPDGAGPLTSPVTTYAYDALNNMTSVTDPRSNVTTYTYDAISRLTETKDDLNGTITNAWDAAGQVTSVTDQLGRVTSYTFDALGRVTEIEDGLLNTTDYAYDDGGNVATVTDALSNVTTYKYDIMSRVTSVTQPDPDGAGPLSAPVTSYVYDNGGQLTTVTDPLSNDTDYEYDNLGRLTSVTDALLNETTFQYDVLNNRTHVTDPLDNTVVTEHDNLSRTIKITDPLSGDTEFAWDAAGNLTSFKDASANTTTYAYDALNRQVSATNELSDARSYVYDASNNVTKITDRKGLVREFTYDDLDRVTDEVWKDGVNTVETIEFTWDAAGQLTEISDSNATYAYEYDDAGRVIEVDNTGTTALPTVILDLGYDDNGNRTSLDATVATVADFENDYTYDNLGRLTKLTQADGAPSSGETVTDKRIDLTYTALNQFSTIERYEDLTATDLVAETTYVYDDNAQLTNLDHDKGATNFADYGWTYNDAGQITQFSSDDGTSDYTYDDNGQLTTADHDYQTDESYSYDDTGNRTNTGYTTGDNNQLTSDGTYNYEYDDEGNRTKKTEIATDDYVEYEWDHRNRLTKVTYRDNLDAKTKEVIYTYDALDRLLIREVDDNGNGTIDSEERFVYDGADVVLVYDGSNDLMQRILHGPAVDQVFAQEDGTGDILWALADNQGTVRDIADYDSGTDTTTVDNHRKFDAYGNITSESDSNVDFRYAFTGRFFDEDTDLQYNRARWYDGTVGRWLSEDPIGFNAGDANINRYVNNNPTNYIDPSGLCPECPPGPSSVTAVAPPPPVLDSSQMMTQEQIDQGIIDAQNYEDNLSQHIQDLVDYGDESVFWHGVGGFFGGGGHGLVMVGNAFTFGQIDYLNDWTDELIEQNGGVYGIANGFANLGAWSLYAAGGVAAFQYVWGALGSTGLSIPTGLTWGSGGGGGLLWAGAGGSTVTGLTATGWTVVNGQLVATGIAALGSLVFMVGNGGPPDIIPNAVLGMEQQVVKLRKLITEGEKWGQNEGWADTIQQLNRVLKRLGEYYRTGIVPK